MKKLLASILGLMVIISACQVKESESVSIKEISPDFVFATWTNAGHPFDSLKWEEKLKLYDSIGISEVLVHGSPEVLRKIVPIADNHDIKIHGWMWTLNRPNDTIANQHPDWYAVNRKGQNSLEYRAYVDYYQWLSPFHPEAREYVKSNVRQMATVPGLASVHLDYVRFVDVILGAQLQPKYGLVQDHQMPEYDYGYHPLAREGFKTIFGKDPIEMDHPDLSTEWLQYRLNAVTSLVNECVEVAHEADKKITAAVFPFPEMSRQMVRQSWSDWNLDAAYPMVYQSFYNENIPWIGFCIEQGNREADFPIRAGLYAPALTTGAELEEAIRLSKEKGAESISIFTADNLNPDQKSALVKLRKEFDLE